MAVVLISQPRAYTGLSTDTKPASAAAGSRFVETDSGRTYISDGSAWALSVEGYGE